MWIVKGLLFIVLCNIGLARKTIGNITTSKTLPLFSLATVEPEYLEMLRATRQDKEFAALLGIDVSLVRPQEGRSEEDLLYTTVSPLGDILLTPEQEEQARQGIDFDRYPGSKWQDNKIPYVISNSDFTLRQRRFIESAMASFNSRTKNLKVVPRSNQNDYVMVISGNGCYSYLGRTGGQQVLSLQRNGCLNNGTIQHEFLHAAGFTHEHNRPDRDDHVRILWENIPSEWRSQYEKANSRAFAHQGAYDHYSVMHYPMSAPGTRKDAFDVLDRSVDSNRIGQRSGPTATDIRKVDVLYA